MMTEIMTRLAARPGLRRKCGFKFIDDRDWPYLEIREPAAVARLVGEAKQSVRRGQVFMRGQTSHFGAMRPSLMRNADGDVAEARRRAQEQLVAKIGSIKATRFQRPDLAALLQHYGFNTTWLDVVDNLFVATWFATHNWQQQDGGLSITASTGTHGWLYLLCARPDEVRYVDLRRDHHPLSTRPHVQHGISLMARKPRVVDLRKLVMATVKFPVGQFTTTGTLFEETFLVPPRSADHTLELLLRHNTNEMAASIEAKCGVPEGTLGRVIECHHKRPNKVLQPAAAGTITSRRG